MAGGGLGGFGYGGVQDKESRVQVGPLVLVPRTIDDGQSPK